MTTPIGTTAETALRQAMERLLAGRPTLTDGRLTVTNLAREAGLSRASAYRAAAIVQAFRDHIRQPAARDMTPTARQDRIAALEAERAALQRQARDDQRALRATVHAMAQRIQALTLLVQEQERRIAGLHDELSRSGVVVPLGRGGDD